MEQEEKYLGETQRRKVINCLSEHFKNISQKLKIVCDWDEVIQCLEPKVYYELSEREGAYYEAPWWMPNGTKFEAWFKNFWLNPPIYYSEYGSHSAYTNKDMVTSCLRKGNSFVTGQRSIKSKIEQIKNEPGFYQRAPFLTIAKELLSLVKQNKVEVTFLSAFDKRVFANGDPRKKQIFSETFGKYPNCSLNLVGFDSEGQGQTKGEWISQNVPECDVVIDDNPNILRNVIRNNDKITAIAPYYYFIEKQHHEKVLLVENALSDLKKQDF